MDKAFAHQHTAHCETGVMSSMLKHHGLNLSEPMVFGLSSGLAFAYLPFVKLNGLPLIAYRMPPRSIIKGLRDRLGLKIRFQKFSSPQRGADALNTYLDNSQIAGLQTSVFWLPYFPEDMRFHFNAHNLIVYGREANEYLISDPVFESPVRCPGDDLSKARFARGALAPKGLMYTIESLPASINYEKAITAAIIKNRRIMYAPIPLAGLWGIRYLAKRIEGLASQYSDIRKIRLYLGHIVRMQEEIGTGGAGFRFIYASFLQESAQLLQKPMLEDASQMMTQAGDKWREFALETVKMCKQRSDLDLAYLAQLLRQCGEEEAKVWQFLKNFKA